MIYEPQVPPQDPEQLLEFIDEEFQKIQRNFNDVNSGLYQIEQAMPKRVLPGMVKYFAAGVAGTFEGLYRYSTGGTWVYIG